MKNVQVRNVPERVHKVLRRRAAEAGQSLQEYLSQLLEREAGRPTVQEVLERARRHATGRWGAGEAARIIREEREKRDEELFRRIRPEQ
jgi:plasmid stability protein